MPDVVCLYMGRADECPECGGHNDTGHRFCSHECAASWDDRAQANAAREQARRDEEDAFGREVDRLRAEGHSYEECDRILANWRPEVSVRVDELEDLVMRLANTLGQDEEAGRG